jgi:hypothetical protein
MLLRATLTYNFLFMPGHAGKWAEKSMETVLTVHRKCLNSQRDRLDHFPACIDVYISGMLMNNPLENAVSQNRRPISSREVRRYCFTDKGCRHKLHLFQVFASQLILIFLVQRRLFVKFSSFIITVFVI